MFSFCMDLVAKNDAEFSAHLITENAMLNMMNEDLSKEKELLKKGIVWFTLNTVSEMFVNIFFRKYATKI